MSKLRTLIGFTVLATVLVGSILFLQRGSGVAPLPPAFAEKSYTYTQAVAASSSRKLPMLVFTSADWCGPCQQFKRGGLADTAVNTKLREATIPVYVNVDHEPDVSAALGVTSIPTLYLVRDGATVSKLVGTKSASEVLSWLDAALKQ